MKVNRVLVIAEKITRQFTIRLFKITTLVLIVFPLTGCGEKSMTKFDWLASESAPENYLMEIVTGSFIFKDGGSLYVPNGKTIGSGWGKRISTHVVGADLKPLPHQLNITFFSYTENAFYQGSFELPYETILSLFQHKYYSTAKRKEVSYNRIVAGVSPGGGVSVWLQGLNKSTQIFYGKAEKADIDWTRITKNEDYSREQYIQIGLDDQLTPEAQKVLKINGVPLNLWGSYQTRYHWRPNFVTENRPPKKISEIYYVNGESEQLFYPLTPGIEKSTRAVPQIFSYTWRTPNDKFLEHDIYFDVEEIITGFEKLHAIKPATAESPVLLTVQLSEHKEGRKIAIALQHGEETVLLKNTELKQFSSLHGIDDIDAFHQD